MKIIKADKTHSNEIIQNVSALLTELSGKPFAVDESKARKFMAHALDEGKYIAFVAVDDSGAIVT